jgi:hypothetical protein
MSVCRSSLGELAQIDGKSQSQIWQHETENRVILDEIFNQDEASVANGVAADILLLYRIGCCCNRK